MDLAVLKKRVQSHLTDGLVTIVGSGLSVAEGIPGMGKLATHLIASVTPRVTVSSRATWDKIVDGLNAGVDLESILLAHPPDSSLESMIVAETTTLLGSAEAVVFERVFSGSLSLRFSKLLPHLLKSSSGIPVITTNYDRLLELAAEFCGLGVDTLFIGHRAGKLDVAKSRFNHCRGFVERKVDGRRRPTLDFAPHVRVLKPHGSFDWYQGPHGPIACAFSINHPRMIITPGLNKYRGGYDPPFDTHREAANREIDRASRYLIIGYGFNDEHLQTHLEPRLVEGKPAILITHSLSPKAIALVKKSPGLLAISSTPGAVGTIVTTFSDESTFPGIELWDVGSLVDEALTP